MKIKKREKRAVFFSTDALVALFIILLTILVVYPAIKYSRHESKLQSDVITVLSSLKIGEVQDPYVQQLIIDGYVENPGKSVLQQIGDLYVTNTAKAEGLAEAMLNYLDTKENIGIWIIDQNGQDHLLASTSPYNENAANIETDRQIISGLKEPTAEGEVTGYFATAFLSHASQKKYFYFGGYTGDGNISIDVPYGEVPEHVDLEVTANTNFNIWINGEKIEGDFEAAESQFTPISFPLDAYVASFDQAINTVKFTPVDESEKLYFAGGYLRVTYKNTEIYNDVHEYIFPGIQGVINIYDSFYVPGKLNDMSVKLDYQSPYNLFLNIGGKTVFSGTSETKTTKEITSEELIAAGIDFDALSRNTTPIRLGLYELGEAIGGNADVVLITDFSGSMKKAISNWEQGNKGTFEGGAGCYNNDYYLDPLLRRAQLAQCVDMIFSDALFADSTGHRLWPVFIYQDEIQSYSGNPSDNAAIKNYILTYPNGMGKTCLACSVNEAYELFSANNNPDRKKFVILMTDGVTTHCAANSCPGTLSEFGTKICEGMCDTEGSCDEDNIPPQCSACSSDTRAIDNLYFSAQRLVDDFDATIYTVGFGPAASECSTAETSLQHVADIGGGDYVSSSNAEELKEIYENIVEKIVALSYVDQMTKVLGDFENTELFSGSSISFDYTPDAIPYGLILTFQTEEFGNILSEGSFYVPPDYTIIEANAISYSGPRWTDKVSIEDIGWNPVFSLEDYGDNYIELGDAYVVNLPLSEIIQGDNDVKITTGVIPGESSEASASDKVIYTLSTDTPTSSGISGFSEGCTWTLEFYDGSFETITIPADYSDGNTCSYASSAFGGIDYNENDAQQSAVFNLLGKLDINEDGRLDAIFTAEDMEIDTSEIVGIPWEWSAEIQVRRWD